MNTTFDKPGSPPLDLETSRAKLLGALAGARDITLIRNYGNMGDHLIHAGTRRLLANVSYHEVSLLLLAGLRGQLAVISGSGAWCHAHAHMPQYLSRIEDQFERVVVFPSSFDVTEEGTRQALSRTKALVFARERASYEQIRDICQAELAYDCALFFDYSPYQRAGQGLLTAYRTDTEAVGRPIPPGNNDISMTCESLDEFLWTIARYETIETDRAHVMIAAALLGKRVYYRPSSYHKVPAIAEYALGSFPVVPLETRERAEVKACLIEQARANLRLLPESFYRQHQQLELTVVMLSHGRLDQTLNAIRALREHVRIPFRMLLVDNGSGEVTQAKLREVSAGDERIELILLDENLGCAGGRDLAFKRVTTSYVLLIDNDLEVLPGAVEHLLHQFDLHPQAAGVTGKVVFPDGRIQVCGANFWVDQGIQFCELLGTGRRFDEEIGVTGACDWVPGCLTLIRTDMLRRFPYDLKMRYYFEDNEWCYRVNEAGAGKFYRVVEALGIHYHESKAPNPLQPVEEKRKQTMKYVETLAYFYRKHGLIYEVMFHFVPELGCPTNQLSVSSAKIFLELVNSNGGDWVLNRWNHDQLAPLFAAAQVAELKRRTGTLGWRLLGLYGKIKYPYLLPVYRLLHLMPREPKVSDKQNSRHRTSNIPDEVESFPATAGDEPRVSN